MVIIYSKGYIKNFRYSLRPFLFRPAENDNWWIDPEPPKYYA